jgi:hypothetical protein
VRFEAETQEAAISKGKAVTAEASATADAWAFAREGLMNNEDGSKADVFLVDFWARGMNEPATIIQPFEPYAKRHHLRIVGTAMLVVDGKIQDSTKAAPLVAQVDAGIRQHSKAAPLWAKWR